jgi:SAM-dependent methyltransferase
MSKVSEHYENLLAEYYTWMFGDFNLKVEENESFFRDNNIYPGLSGIAIDLGSGPGYQSIALAKAGFQVTAVDQSKKLLDELADNKVDLPVTLINDDILKFQSHITDNAELIVCMGDTLTHLESKPDVEDLLYNSYKWLEDSGKLILSFRDLTYELKETDRFIPVKSDDITIFTCFLEYEKSHVKVHDLIYTKEDDSWTLNKSFYKKLILDPEWITQLLKKLEFRIIDLTINKGMVTIISQK